MSTGGTASSSTGGMPCGALFSSMTTCAVVSAVLESTTPQGAAAGLTTASTWSRSTAQNSQPTLEGASSATWQASLQAPSLQISPAAVSQTSTTSSWLCPLAAQRCTSLPTQTSESG
jgi:hypothetical protein